VAVSAASGTGKSSTAAHLIAHGAEFFTDDVLALEVIDGEIVAFAGPQIAGLVEHEALAIDPARRERLGEYLGMSDKQLRRPALAQTSLPLGALYLLERDPDVEAVTIDALDTSGTAMLLASAFIPHLSTDARRGPDFQGTRAAPRHGRGRFARPDGPRAVALAWSLTRIRLLRDREDAAAEAVLAVEDQRRRLLARANAESPESGEHVALDGALGNEQLVGDLAVAEAHHHERHDLLLARRQDGFVNRAAQ
jgi:hypothetical protein